MSKIIFISAILFALAGCSSSPTNSNLSNYNIVKEETQAVNGHTIDFVTFKQKGPIITKENGKSIKQTAFSFGSGFQWNEDYIVTAKHVAFVENSAFLCKEGCDIQFIKRKATQKISMFRDRKPLEQVTFLGVDQNDTIKQQSGFDLDTQTFTSLNSTVLVNWSSAVTFGGMSGGPVVANDGSVIGMLTSGSFSPVDGKEISIFLSISDIQNAWNDFQKTQVSK